MYRIVRRRELNPTVTQIEVEAPLVARKARPGQFIILRVDEEGERIPLTVAGTDPAEGTVKVIFQVSSPVRSASLLTVTKLSLSAAKADVGRTLTTIMTARNNAQKRFFI